MFVLQTPFDLGTGDPWQRQESFADKENRGNSKVNRTTPSSTHPLHNQPHLGKLRAKFPMTHNTMYPNGGLTNGGFQCYAITTAKGEALSAVKSSGLNARWSQGRANEFRFVWFSAWSLVVYSVCQRAFALLEIQFKTPWFESCIQQRKTIGLLSIRYHFAVASASKSTPTNIYIARVMGEAISGMGSSGLNDRRS